MRFKNRRIFWDGLQVRALGIVLPFDNNSQKE
jgi:hypothetical protein